MKNICIETFFVDKDEKIISKQNISIKGIYKSIISSYIKYIDGK